MRQPFVGGQAAAADGIHRAGVLHGHPVGLDHLGRQGAGHKGGQQTFEVEVQPGFCVDLPVKKGKPGIESQQRRLQLFRLGRGARQKGFAEGGFIRGHDRRVPPQNLPPARRLQGVDQLIFRHPLLPRKLVLDAEEIVCMGAAQVGQHRAFGQLEGVDGTFEVKPGQIVQHGFPGVALPSRKKAADQRVAVVFVDKPYDAVHVKVDRSIGVAGEEQRLKAIGTGCRPDLIGSAPFLCGVALRFHQPNSLAASSLAGMRAAMASRMRLCS